MNIQKGGVDPLLKVPTFKYTTSIARQRFINAIYPYSVYILDTLNEIDFSSYSYNGLCEYTSVRIRPQSEEIIVSDYEDILQDTNQITIDPYSRESPKSYYFGGTVYEILNRRFRNPDLHRYCDVTGDIDIMITNPQLPYFHSDDTNEYTATFFTNSGINIFYKDFTEWCFNTIKAKIKKLKYVIRQIEGAGDFISFELTDYHEIPPENYRNEQFGYLREDIGNVKIIGFVTYPGNSMYKIQVVGKVGEHIDHFIEYVILIDPEPSLMPQFETVQVNGTFYNIQSFNNLIIDNMISYQDRLQLYDTINTHKVFNHVGRLLYLFELFYQNQDDNFFKTDSLIIVNLFKYINGTSLDEFLEYTRFFKYYKIVEKEFIPINIEVKFLLYAYFILLKKNLPLLNHFVFQPPVLMRNKHEELKELTYSNYFDDIGVEMTPECIKEHEDRFKAIHDLFIEKLFNDDRSDIIYTPPRFQTTMCGGKRNMRKIRKTYKKINNKKTYKRKTYKRKQLYKKKKHVTMIKVK